MEITSPGRATLVDLLDRVLDRGLVLNIDLLICLAGVPLLGVSLRAMLAGMETMLDYGMMADWDIVQREFERARHHLAVPGPEYLVPQGREPSK